MCSVLFHCAPAIFAFYHSLWCMPCVVGSFCISRRYWYSSRCSSCAPLLMFVLSLVPESNGVQLCTAKFEIGVSFSSFCFSPPSLACLIAPGLLWLLGESFAFDVYSCHTGSLIPTFFPFWTDLLFMFIAGIGGSFVPSSSHCITAPRYRPWSR